MNFDAGRFWLDLIQWIATIAIGIYAWLSHRHSANAIELGELREEFAVIEERLKHVPDQNLVHALHSDMRAVQARLDGIQKSLDPLAKALDRINDYLLNHK